GFGVDADDFAELADEHHLSGFVDEVDGGELADFGRGLHGDDARAAAGLKAIGVDGGAFAVAVVAHGEDEAGGDAELGVELLEACGGLLGDLRLVRAEDLLAVGGAGASSYVADGGSGRRE